jgi:hypothetical protein
MPPNESEVLAARSRGWNQWLSSIRAGRLDLPLLLRLEYQLGSQRERKGVFSDGFEAGNAGCWSSAGGGSGGTVQGSCTELVPVRRYAHRQGKILASVDEQAPGTSTHYYHLNYRDTPNIVSDTIGNFGLRVYMSVGEEVTTGGTTFELPR